MALQRGDVVLIPFPYTDLTATKTRPALVISSAAYQSMRSELLLAYISSQVTNVMPTIDYMLQDWKQAGLPKPSFMRPKVAAIEPSLVVHRIGQLSDRDSKEVDRRLRHAMALTATALPEIIQDVDFSSLPPTLLQTLAEKSVTALAALVAAGYASVDLSRIRQISGYVDTN